MARKTSLIRRLTLSVLMPFILLLSQQGALRHELSHLHAVSASSGQQAHAGDADDELCLTCLSFAQIAGLAKFDVPTPPDAAGLHYHFAPDVVVDVAEASTPAVRSRGPPHFL